MGESGLKGSRVSVARAVPAREAPSCLLPVPATTPLWVGKGVPRRVRDGALIGGDGCTGLATEFLWSFPKMDREAGVGAPSLEQVLPWVVVPRPPSADRFLVPLHRLEVDSLCLPCRGALRPAQSPTLCCTPAGVSCVVREEAGGHGGLSGALGAGAPCCRAAPAPPRHRR